MFWVEMGVFDVDCAITLVSTALGIAIHDNIGTIKKCNEAHGRKHKTSIDWTMVAVRVISRWLKRAWVLIGDGGFACIRLGMLASNNR